ncbi:hypothetical protein BKA93DRAFT_782650 [Sparassis latifolia]
MLPETHVRDIFKGNPADVEIGVPMCQTSHLNRHRICQSQSSDVRGENAAARINRQNTNSGKFCGADHSLARMESGFHTSVLSRRRRPRCPTLVAACPSHVHEQHVTFILMSCAACAKVFLSVDVFSLYFLSVITTPSLSGLNSHSCHEQNLKHSVNVDRLVFGTPSNPSGRVPPD